MCVSNVQQASIITCEPGLAVCTPQTTSISHRRLQIVVRAICGRRQHLNVKCVDHAREGIGRRVRLVRNLNVRWCIYMFIQFMTTRRACARATRRRRRCRDAVEACVLGGPCSSGRVGDGVGWKNTGPHCYVRAPCQLYIMYSVHVLHMYIYILSLRELSDKPLHVKHARMLCVRTHAYAHVCRLAKRLCAKVFS